MDALGHLVELGQCGLYINGRVDHPIYFQLGASNVYLVVWLLQQSLDGDIVAVLDSSLCVRMGCKSKSEDAYEKIAT